MAGEPRRLEPGMLAPVLRSSRDFCQKTPQQEDSDSEVNRASRTSQRTEFRSNFWFQGIRRRLR